MKPPPSGWPRISASVYYDDARTAIDFLCRAFGFEVRLKVEGEGGRIEHSELTYGEGLVMVGNTGVQDEAKAPWKLFVRSPRSLEGANTQGLCIYVDDAEAHCARARAEGAEIIREPKVDDYGSDYWADCSYGARDLEGHQWWFMQRMRSAPK